MIVLLRGAAAGAVGLLSLVAGGTWSALHMPGARTQAVTEHIAAGTVFAGLAGSVLFRLLQEGADPWLIVAGMAVGLAAMLAIRFYTARAGSAGGLGLAVTIVADVLTDGVLMGLSVATGHRVSLVFVAALVPELTLLGLTLTDELGGVHWGALKRIGVPALVGLGVVTGGVLGAWAHFGPGWLHVLIYSFGAITLSYLVMEELLREAHEKKEPPWMPALFFVGFIPFFVAAATLVS